MLVEVAAWLVGKGAKVDVPDKDGDTALHWAANKGMPWFLF
jgi:ankyrin repeat protein